MDDRSTTDLYTLLGVPQDAPVPEIRRAYRRLARRHHPDLSERPDGHEHFARLAGAYEVLRNPTRRASYDLTLPPPAVTSKQTNSASRSQAHMGVRVCRGILELSAAEASYVARNPLALRDLGGLTVLLPAGTRDGDQIAVRHGSRAVILMVRAPKRT